MSETLQTPENEINPAVPPESAEFLDNEFKKAENRGNHSKPIQLNDVGSEKAAREVFSSLQNARRNAESEIPQLTEEQQREALNSLLKSTERAIDTGEADPFDAIESLKKVIPGN